MHCVVLLFQSPIDNVLILTFLFFVTLLVFSNNVFSGVKGVANVVRRIHAAKIAPTCAVRGVVVVVVVVDVVWVQVAPAVNGPVATAKWSV